MPYEFEGEPAVTQNGRGSHPLAQESLTFEAEPLELDVPSGEVDTEEESAIEASRRKTPTRRFVKSGSALSPGSSGVQKPPMEPRKTGNKELDLESLDELEIVPPTDSRTRVADTKKIPFRLICSVIPTFRHPTTGAELEMKTQPGSGFLIGPRHVLTAAHVLFPTDGPLAHQSPVRVKVTPGHDSNSRPYGDYVSTEYFVRSEWRSGGRNTDNMSFDFAIIKLPTSILAKGLKCWGEASTNTERYPLAKAWLKGKVVNVSGYPRDKSLYTQWIAYDQLDVPEATRNGSAVPNVFLYKADTCLGQSGSPVWWYDGKSKRYLVGIHTGYGEGLDGCTKQSGAGCMPGSSRWSHNRGVLFTHEVQQQVQAWLK
jgi:V8-like Glu-specific endopeptidase